MLRFTRILLYLAIFLSIQNLYSQEINITEKSVNACYEGEFTRGSGFTNKISSTFLIELEDLIAFKTGFFIGKTLIDTDIGALVNIDYSPFPVLPLIFSLTCNYNGFPEYESHTFSLFPHVSFNAKYAGISLGMNFRLSSFFGEPAYFESIFSFFGYVNFINKESLRIGIGAGNFKEFHAKNLGAYFLSINALIRIIENWYLLSDIEYMQSGGDGFSTTFLGIALRLGVKYSW